MLSSANPFAADSSIEVTNGGVKVAALDLPSQTATDATQNPIIGQQTATNVAAPAKTIAQAQGMEVKLEALQGGANPTVTAKIDLAQTNSFSFAVKDAVVIKTPIDQIQSIKATTGDNQPLPNWLKFDAGTQTFSAVNPPANALPITTTVNVVDKAGNTQQIPVTITQ